MKTLIAKPLSTGLALFVVPSLYVLMVEKAGMKITHTEARLRLAHRILRD